MISGRHWGTDVIDGPRAIGSYRDVGQVGVLSGSPAGCAGALGVSGPLERREVISGWWLVGQWVTCVIKELGMQNLVFISFLHHGTWTRGSTRPLGAELNAGLTLQKKKKNI